MFYGATAFNQNISKWNVSSATYKGFGYKSFCNGTKAFNDKSQLPLAIQSKADIACLDYSDY